MARGAALSLGTLFDAADGQAEARSLLDKLQRLHTEDSRHADSAPPFFRSEEERAAFEQNHALPEWVPYQPEAGETVRAWLGIDSGSTTTKFVLMAEDETLLDAFYAPNQGVSRENIALSAFHAVAKQTIGGLAQGLEIQRPVAFEGGPLTFNPTLV